MLDRLLDVDARTVIAHRGDRVRAPENTIEGLQRAVDIGVDAIEFDVRVTRDGVPVLMHDPTVDRTTNGRGLVGSFSCVELRRLDAAARFGSGDASAQIPLLEEAMDRFRRLPLIIEVKEATAIDATVAMIDRFDARGRVLLGSPVTPVTEALQRAGLRICASMRDATRMIPVALVGATPAPQKYDVLSISPWFRGLPIPVLRMAAAARKLRIATHVWTVNDPQRAVAYWRGGVSGIVTDDPLALLRARPK